MAIWIEIRCEGRGSGDHGCWSDSNNDVGTLCSETNVSLINANRSIGKLARGAGYERRNDGWYCPACVAIDATRKDQQ